MQSNILKIFQERVIFLLMDSFPLLILLLSLLFLYKLISPNSTPKKNLPPSPPWLPIIGNLHQLGTLPFRSLQTLSQKHGDLMLIYFGSKPTIIISSAEVASQVLRTHDLIFANRPNSSIPRRLLYNGKEVLLSSYGEHFKQLRRILMLHLLGSNKVRSHGEVRKEEVALMIKNIDAQVLTTVNLGDLFMSLSKGLTCRLAFGKKYSGSEDGLDFRKMMDSFFELLGGFNNIGDFISWLGWINKINGVEAKLNNVISSFDSLLERILEDHSNSGTERSTGDGLRMQGFVDFLLQVQKEDDTTLQNHLLDRETIKGVILDILAAGTHTLSVDIEWMMSELLRNPTTMQELQKEVSRVAGGKENVTEDDLEKMDYLKAVHKETLRLHPPSPLLFPHISTEDTVINGYDISAGTTAIVNVRAICRNPTYWDEAERFYPERFLNFQVDFKGRDFQFTPFGSGRRMCPGMGYATALVELTVANLVHHFDWSLPDGVKPESLNMAESHGITSHRVIPLHAIPSPKNR